MDDLISRQEVIDAIAEERFPIDSDYAEGFMAAIDKVEWILKEWLPSTQPNLQPTCNQLATDCIRRQAAIDEIDEWIKAFRENGHKESAADACLIQDGIIQLPSAQPRKGKWVPHHEINMLDGSIGGVTCSVCEWRTHNKLHLLVGCPYNFCPNCGSYNGGEQNG